MKYIQREDVSSPLWDGARVERLEREAVLRRHLLGMRETFGERDGKRCGTCLYCVDKRVRGRRIAWKCRLVGMEGEDTDWHRAWAACGRYEAKR